MAGTFAARSRELGDMIGEGSLTGSAEVNQVYALPQHSGFWRTGPLAGVQIRNHPRGGKSHFLSDPLMANAQRYLRNLADGALGGRLVQAMAENMEDLSDHVRDQAPREFEDLRNSAHPKVLDNGRVAYDRAPLRPRLSQGALGEKARRRQLGEGPSRGSDALPFRG